MELVTGYVLTPGDQAGEKADISELLKENVVLIVLFMLAHQISMVPLKKPSELIKNHL